MRIGGYNGGVCGMDACIVAPGSQYMLKRLMFRRTVLTTFGLLWIEITLIILEELDQRPQNCLALLDADTDYQVFLTLTSTVGPLGKWSGISP